LPLQK